MIDRSYLPFQSAREHQDRGMMKWMGFFLSEHTTSLIDDKSKVDMSSELTKLDKLTLITQLYVGRLTGIFEVKSDKRKERYTGQVTEISPSEITIKTADKYQLLQVDDILGISSMEELGDEQERDL
ncbi:hypothetical protein [Streptococcus sanguinis]|uniref:hypothetical protein n=1 Tax=Streptococcus sanguinis TaxID=1305 RepID=UPI001CBC5DF1|nr:hypothetical protein [Streptococcus sanguinis]MBZ2062625.1 hypothetical protein [Streptococcus sanguinis]MBZ2064836.1 hypothetical protein [Streptococcus sanguinis]HES1965627.1 hypothetical protein [Streptococcus pyogenes]